MCTPDSNALAKVAVSLVGDVISGIKEHKEIKDNNKYRMRIALNNAKEKEQKALKEKQYGIEEVRKEKIKAISEIAKQKAEASSNGFDLNSDTNLFSYEDTLNNYETNINSIEKNQETKVDSYTKEANDFFNQANSYKKNYNKSLIENSFNALGKFKKVSPIWYRDEGEF